MNAFSKDYFQNSITITGVHADMVHALWVKNNPVDSYFRRLIDVYLVAPIIGFRLNRKGNLSFEDGKKATIFTEQIQDSKYDFEMIMQMILLLEDDFGYTEKERINHAFMGPKDEEEYNKFLNLFHSYALGGIEFMYERLVIKKVDPSAEISDQKTGAILALIKRFS